MNLSNKKIILDIECFSKLLKINEKKTMILQTKNKHAMTLQTHRIYNLLKKEERSFFTDSEYKLERPHMQEVAVSIPLWSNEKAEGKDKDTRMVWLGQQFLLKITR